jgi:hypothetical protein
MAVVTKTFSFASNVDGFDDNASGLTLSWDSGDGSPSNGSLKATGTSDIANISNITTWEAMGVPSGATVTAVECTGCKYKLDDANTSSLYITILKVGTNDFIASLVAEDSTTGDNTWRSATLTGAQSPAVSATDIYIFIDAYCDSVSTKTWHFDTISIDITYTAGGGGGLSIPVAMNSYRQRRV